MLYTNIIQCNISKLIQKKQKQINSFFNNQFRSATSPCPLGSVEIIFKNYKIIIFKKI